MEPQQPLHESVDQTLIASVERIRTSRELLDQIDERLARGVAMLETDVPEIDLRDDAERW